MIFVEGLDVKKLKRYQRNVGYAIYRNGNRWAGYGVSAYCEHPDCNEEIDRGMSYACGQEPFNYGCSNYFCSKHTSYELVESNCNPDKEEDEECTGEYDDCCVYKDICERCKNGGPDFGQKPEHPEWVYHLLNHPSWEEWRGNNPEEVKKLEKLPSTIPEYWDNEKE